MFGDIGDDPGIFFVLADGDQPDLRNQDHPWIGIDKMVLRRGVPLKILVIALGEAGQTVQDLAGETFFVLERRKAQKEGRPLGSHRMFGGRRSTL